MFLAFHSIVHFCLPDQLIAKKFEVFVPKKFIEWEAVSWPCGKYQISGILRLVNFKPC